MTIERAIAGIKPPTTMGTNSVPGFEYPFVDGSEVKGHPIQVDTIADLYGWPVAWRQWGQLAFVVNDPAAPGFDPAHPTPAEFQLQNAFANHDLSANINWVPRTAAATEPTEQWVAGASLMSGRAVQVVSGTVVYAQPDNIANIRAIGITLTAANPPNPATVLTFGKFAKSNSFTGSMFWLGSDGVLLGEPPTDQPFKVPLGRVLSGAELFFSPGIPTEEVL